MHNKHSNIVIRFMEFIIAMLLGGSALIVFMNVILRYIFHSGVRGTEDLSRFMFIWLAYIGIVVVMAERGHLGVDLVLHALPRKARQVVGIIGHVLMIFALSLLLIGCWKQMLLNNNTMAMGAIAYPLSWNYAAGVFAGIGCLFLTLRSLVKIARGDLSEIDYDPNNELIEEGLHQAELIEKSGEPK